jgi:hypothetical protein
MPADEIISAVRSAGYLFRYYDRADALRRSPVHDRANVNVNHFDTGLSFWARMVVKMS